MKKIALFVPLCLCTLLGAKAQDSLQAVADDDSFKARRGRLATELNVNPFQGALSLNNAINQIKFRYFASDGLALRLAFTATTLKSDVNRSVPFGSSPNRYEQTRQTTTAGVNLGVERHFRGTRRLSPYVGAEVAFTSKSSSDEIKTDFSTTKVKGAWQQTTLGTGGVDYVERGFVRYGLNVISGFDFYMARHFYLGYEFAFGLASTKYKDIDVNTLYTSNPPPINPGAGSLKADEKNFTAGPALLNGIRIGYVF